ncbi:MAG: M23 family metallopeptidase [Bilophila wadsworthia]
MLGAKFTNQNKQHTAYLFHNERGRETYYNAEGDNLHRELLKAPLSFLRVTSRYSMARRHPVFGNTRPHQGIDYGAPTGTPIMAVGDGVITNIGRAGGYGKQVIIATQRAEFYGHMSRLPKA